MKREWRRKKKLSSQLWFISARGETSEVDRERKGHFSATVIQRFSQNSLDSIANFGVPIHHFLLNYALTFNIYQPDILFIDHIGGKPFFFLHFTHKFLTLADNHILTDCVLLAAQYYKYFPLRHHRTSRHNCFLKKYFITKHTHGLRHCQFKT